MGAPASGIEEKPSVGIGQGARAAVVDDAERSHPDECCGFLFGVRREGAVEVTRAYAVHNQREVNRRRRFEISPGDFMTAESRADGWGLELVGIYHSHPDHPAIPSAYDQERALPNLLYLIVGTRQGRVAEERWWELKPDRSGFEEVSMRPPAVSGKEQLPDGS